VTQVLTSIQRVAGGVRFRIAHAEDPHRPGVALCGTRLRGTPTTAAGERCAVCLDLARRTFVGR
jgi:hypothetical protein